ncbi:MAG: hypothetical protein JWQ36_2333 [Enterovirga sp.]|nr:hypothetical protein [Enterovirga sp.]
MPAMVAMNGMAVQSNDKNWEAIFNADVRFTAFTSTRVFPAVPNNNALAGFRASGSQFYLPFALSVNGNVSPDFKFESTIRSGYIVTSRQTVAGISGNYSGTTDTVLSATGTYLGIAGFQPFFSINSNLPTGTPALFGRNILARLDADIVDVATFGQGFTVGPTIGANIPINDNLIGTLSFGYTYVGPFRNEFFTGALGPPAPPFQGMQQLAFGPIPGQRLGSIDPSDSITGLASLGYSEGPLSLSGSVLYSVQITDLTRDGIPIVRQGDRIAGDIQATYAFTEDFSASVSGQIVHTNNNLAPGALGPLPLVQQRPNINRTLYRIGIDTSYRVSERLALGPAFSVRYQDRNAFNPTTLTFLPSSIRYGLGGSAQYTVTDNISVLGRFERIWLENLRRPDVIDPLTGLVVLGSGTAGTKTDGYAFAGSVTYRF